jgi:hypothetical protein
MSDTAKRAAERIWQKYERHLDNPTKRGQPGAREGQTSGPNQDKDAFIVTVTSIIDGAIRESVNATLDHALNSGDGSYRP